MGGGLALTFLLAGGGTVLLLLLLLGYCLRRRLHGKTRKQIARDVNGDIEAESSAKDAANTAEADAEPKPELVTDSRPVARDGAVDSPLRPPFFARPPFKQGRVKASQLSPRAPRPMRLPHAGMLSGRGMLSSAAAKEVTDGSDRAAPKAATKAAPKAAPEAAPEAGPATDSCGARASDDGESGQLAGPFANGQHRLGIANFHLAVGSTRSNPDALVPSVLPEPEHRLTARGAGQGKFSEAVEVEPTSKADKPAPFLARAASPSPPSLRARAATLQPPLLLARAASTSPPPLRARAATLEPPSLLARAAAPSPPSLLARARSRADIKDTETELDKMFTAGTKGTKDGPGRFTSRSGTLPVHYPFPALTTSTPLKPRPPTRKGKPDDLWALVRARRADIQAADALRASVLALRERGLPDRQTGLSERREERMRRLSKERWQRSQRSHRGLEGLSSGGGPIVRV